MASTLSLSYFLNTLTLSFLLSASHILSLKTTIFDVSSSLNHTQTIFTHTHTTLSHAQTPTPSSPSHLILSLHPRFSLYNTHHKNYTQLTLSRLARDSTRVNSLTRPLNSVSQLGTRKSSNSPGNLQTPVSSGIRQGSGEYFTRIGIGTPPRQYYMVIDTGSDVNWIQCKPCSNCYPQSDPIFDPTRSSSYATIRCGSPQCNSLDLSSCTILRDTCLYQVQYGDGSVTVGDLSTETVSFGNSGRVPYVAIGCGHENEGLFTGAAGLIGLGRNSLSLPSQIKAKSLSYCLVNRDSVKSSTLEFNSVSPRDSVTAPLLHNSKMPSFFYVGMSGISVGDEMVPISSKTFEIDAAGHGGIIIDSGTAVTRLATRAYNSLRDSFVKSASHLPRATEFELFDTCYNFGKLKKVRVPTVSFHFKGGETLSLKAENYMVPVDGTGKYCLAFAPATGSPSIIGNIQQQGTRVTYDLANSVVAFSPDKC